MHSRPATPSAARGHCWRGPPPLTRPSDGTHPSFPVGAGRTLSRCRGPFRGLRCGGEAATASRAGLGGRQASTHQVPRQREARPRPRSTPPLRRALLWPARSASTVPSRGGQAPPVPLVVSWPRYGTAGGPAAAVCSPRPDGEGLAAAHGRAPTLRVPGGGGGPRAATANRTNRPRARPAPTSTAAAGRLPPPLRDGAGRGGRHSACRRRSPLAGRSHRLRRRPAPRRTAATCPPRPPVAAAFVQVGRAGWSVAGGGWRAAVPVCVPRRLTVEPAW